MSEYGDLAFRETIGQLMLRDHQFDPEKDRPIGLAGSMLKRRDYKKGLRDKWSGDVRQWLYAAGGGEDLALYPSGATESLPDEPPKDVGEWAGVFPAVYTRDGMYFMHDGRSGDPRYEPWEDVTDQGPDGVLGDGDQQFISADLRMPRGGEVGILVPGTDDDVMRALFFAQRKLVAQHLGPLSPEYSEPVYDIIEGPDETIGRIDHSRGSGLHSLMRVISLTDENKKHQKPYQYQIAVFGGEHQGDFTGKFMVSAPTNVEDRFAKRTCDKGPNGNKSTPAGNRPAVTRDSLTDNVNAYMMVNEGGPIHPRYMDKGYINTDGEPVTHAGIQTDAFFTLSEYYDGPLMFQDAYFPDDVEDHAIKVHVYRQFDCELKKWREWSTSNVGNPTPPHDDPPPVIPPTSGGGPPDRGGRGTPEGGWDGGVTSGDSRNNRTRGNRGGNRGGTGTGGTGTGGTGTAGNPTGKPNGSTIGGPIDGDGNYPGGWRADPLNPEDWSGIDVGRPPTPKVTSPILPKPGAGGASARCPWELSTASLEFETCREAGLQAYEGRFGFSDGRAALPVKRPISMGMHARGSVDSLGHYGYKSDPSTLDVQAIWEHGTAEHQYLMVGPAYVLPDGPDDQSDWVTSDSYVGFYNGWATGGSSSATQVGWVDWDASSGIPIDGPLFGIQGSSGDINLTLDFLDETGSQRPTGTSSDPGAFLPAVARYHLGAPEQEWDANLYRAEIQELVVGGSADFTGATVTGLTVGGPAEQTVSATGAPPSTIALSASDAPSTLLRVDITFGAGSGNLGTVTGASGGALLTIYAAGIAFTIDHGGGVSAGDFTHDSGANRTISAGQKAQYVYDDTDDTWRQIT